MSFNHLLSTDVITNVVAVGTTVSLVYTYRYDIMRKGLLGLSYVKEALQKKPFCVSALNQVEDNSTNPQYEDAIRLFSHVDKILFEYDEHTNPLSESQEASLRVAILNWRAYPLNGISQHISLYDVLYKEYTKYESEARFPTSITIVYDTLLMDLTESNIIVTAHDKNDVVLKKHVSNHLVWPMNWNKPLDETKEASPAQGMTTENQTLSTTDCASVTVGATPASVDTKERKTE